MAHSFDPKIIPSTAEAFSALDRPLLRILQTKGPCLIAGKIIDETDSSLRVVFVTERSIQQKWYRKSDRTHTSPCRYCPG